MKFGDVYVDKEDGEAVMWICRDAGDDVLAVLRPSSDDDFSAEYPAGNVAFETGFRDRGEWALQDPRPRKP